MNQKKNLKILTQKENQKVYSSEVVGSFTNFLAFIISNDGLDDVPFSFGFDFKFLKFISFSLFFIIFDFSYLKYVFNTTLNSFESALSIKDNTLMKSSPFWSFNFK